MINKIIEYSLKNTLVIIMGVIILIGVGYKIFPIFRWMFIRI